VRVVIEIPQISQPLLKGVAARARSYQFAQVLELMQQNEQKEQFFMVIRNYKKRVFLARARVLVRESYFRPPFDPQKIETLRPL